ncbi:glycine--tRNA ligase subunit beta [Hyphococcus sp.]|uniref:glycine--tRNA ligase subunit beta n=1 Tax=Hyphococcus sp. TaxID=2038636 RepID=UPI0035C77ED1
MSELLLELFSEEIPARMQGRAAADLEKAVNKALMDAGFMPEGVKGFAGPRRLTVVAAGVPARQPDRREEKKGPRVGAPDKAVEGFLKSAGLTSLDQCEQREDKKGAYWVAVIDQKGRDTGELIAEFVPQIVRGFSWPKSMRWGDGELRWVRPLHSILCVFDGEVVNFEIDGIKSGDKTQGHRFLAPGEIQARSFESYAAALKKAKVILDAEERKEMIAGDAATLCKAQGLELVDDPGLLNEVSGLAEWPVPMMGSFDEKFLSVPDEVLTASMRGHQKYFSVKDPKTGRLANRFVYVANIEAPDGGAAMREGYERVLTARLSDAWFLYNQDLKRSLESRVEDLNNVTFFEGLGSIGDKARRIAALAKEIAPSVGADPAAAERAALLAKADLVTGMVYEFPELQGVMGRYYYLAQSASALRDAGLRPAPQGEGANVDLHPEEARSAVSKDEDQQIADAIRDHYKPAGQDDEVPTAPVSVAVALADKIDTLTAFWAIDKKPTGSSDPFALRRAALGVIRLLVEKDYKFDLWKHIILSPAWIFLLFHGGRRFLRDFDFDKKIETPEDLIESWRMPENWQKTIMTFASGRDDRKFRDEVFLPAVQSVIEFELERLFSLLKDSGKRHDLIMATISYPYIGGRTDPLLIIQRLDALEAFLKTDDGANLAAAYKRAGNILKAEEKKDKKQADPDAVDEKLLKDAEEKALYAAMKDAEAAAEKAVAAEDFEAAMSALAQLRKPLDAFFEKVTVNADDAKLRANRLSLLARLTAATAKVADFSKLEG